MTVVTENRDKILISILRFLCYNRDAWLIPENITSTTIFRLRESCIEITCNVPSKRRGARYWVTYFNLLLLNYGIHNTARLSSFYTYVNHFNFRQGITLIALILALLIDNLQLYIGSNICKKFNVDKKNQLDVTFCILYFSSKSCSTCLGQPCTHHQELTTAWCYSLVLVCAMAAGRWSSPVGR